MMRIIYLLAMLLLAKPIFGVTVDGSLTSSNKSTVNPQSEGSFDINVTKSDEVHISNLNSLIISNDGNGTDITASDDVCYYTTTAQYAVDMDSVNSIGGNFNLTHSSNSTKKISYTLYWDDAKDGSNEATFTNNSDTQQTFASNNRTSTNCQTTGGTNARITVDVNSNSYNAMPAGLYTDTVHITLKAQ